MKSKLMLAFIVLALFVSTYQSWVSADSTAPQITSVTAINSDDSPTIEIRGVNFGLDINAVKVFINNTNMTAKILKIKKKKLTVQLPSSQLCSGTLNLKVVVNRVPSNSGQIDFFLGNPIIEKLSPQHAQPGSVVEIKGNGLSCQPNNNLVMFNNESAELLAANGDTLSVRVPEKVSNGNATVKILVGGHTSNTISFNVDPKSSNGDGSGDVISSGNKFLFNNTTGTPGAAGFGPMLSIKNTVVTSSATTTTWDLNFYGTHYAIVNAPWKTEIGTQQLAMVMMDCRYNSNLPGNFTGKPERYVYVLISYPRDPEKPYDPVENPFFWGSLSLASENFPHGEVIYNSLARSNGGVDSFELSKDTNGRSKFSMSAKVIAPDLGYYEDYGINYSKAGKGKVFLPKVATVKIEVDQVEPDVPTGRYNFGKVTLTDATGRYGSITTDKAQFHAKIALDDVMFLW